MKSSDILKAIHDGKHIAVMRTEEAEIFIEIAQTIIEKGLNIIEVTLTTPNALNIIEKLSEREDALIGAGTVLDAVSARNAIMSGARFIVSPSFDKETAKIANLYDIPYIPGCMTVKEMVESLQYGCKVLKLFPATQFTPKTIKDFKGPLPQIEIVPTGGIDKTNHREWLDAGSFAVGIGSEITKVFQEQGKSALEQYVLDLKSEVQ
ncbi:bifunctional 4-hydroxy-2-oxoglutarate aldolase/2-dehydro-3-deoxy-phosphogluconate aldolase [Staphylococcus sp. ACRSN]|uniref:bifunctional 4-hydroxy-2-oxoglutarate aldolase/2-dehydro-3-deoxy-phosphogluconate aldolase n=1 Tax=Staphylococcus sp. ACRSN TaxID=2918214 RepID=UPI001EF3A932|nr:bifunctional 4-hydroxy-2-oxoglutarate aldolase/2-dehydro-3-deoxy-phosphogluconate aldolase [Staphylococcus sp. ACRSN]MCG7339237.1 bifunctional 4-hydroxy-2-oxoglutarate aldolase/2-dehydro-3-deoxy-phosphogluconate aldolase [Staphylococcus sp. ACRSN]